MSDEELCYFALCAPLEDAVDLIDAGKPQQAKILLQRILAQAKEQMKKNRS
ncbi:MAG: hypothetical protein LKJ86_02720 [Oscillibacter sp.]|nr:hypothetical protein [Oscillibacter sp.]